MAEAASTPHAARAGVMLLKTERMATVRELYATDQISLDDLERAIEKELLRQNRRHPVPEGWEPLPPCEHEWIDITAMGDRWPMRLCGWCGERSETL